MLIECIAGEVGFDRLVTQRYVSFVINILRKKNTMCFGGCC